MATPALIPQNKFSTTLATAVSGTDTTVYLNALPTANEGYLTFDEGLSTEEIMYYTSKGANFVTLPSVAAGRGVGGTSAVGHSVGAVVKMKMTAEYWKALQDGTAMATNSVGAQTLSASAITLGYAEITTTATTASTTDTAVTGLSVAVTIPLGGRKVRVTVGAPQVSNTGSRGATAVNVWDGAVTSGTKLQEAIAWSNTGGDTNAVLIQRIYTPSAGSKTFSVGFRASANTAALNSGTTNPSFIHVEAV